MLRCCLVCLAGVMLSACTSVNEEKVRNAQRIDFTLQRTLPHDTKAFTQGLLIHEGQLYESTGQEGSWIGVVDVGTGIADKKVILDNKYFGEGIVILNNKVYQLTWQSQRGFIYALPSFERIGEFSYQGEGWGLTTDGQYLVMSDGTENLTFLDTVTLKPAKVVSVQYEGNPVSGLNELEYADGSIYANIWRTEVVARIDASSGEVTGYLDLTELTRQARMNNPQIDVLNGIAWHPTTKTMLVTGKHWPYIFILKLKE